MSVLRVPLAGIANTVAGLGSGLARLLDAWIVHFSYARLFALNAVIGASGFGLMHWSVKEPRQSRL